MIVNKQTGSGGGGSYVLPTATASRLGGVKIGSGITVQNDGTISVTGGTGGGGDVYYLNDMTQTELVALYDKIAALYAENPFQPRGTEDRFFYQYTYYGKFYGWVEVFPASINSGGTSGTTYYLTGLGKAQSGNEVVKIIVRLKSDGTTGATGSGIVDMGGSNTKIVMLNKLTQQERLDLYNEITAMYDSQSQSFTTAYTEDMYAFYIDLRDLNDVNSYSLNDKYEGFFPMQLCRVHPSDYGGGLFFEGLECERNGNLAFVNIKYVITYEGDAEHQTYKNSIPAPKNFYIYSNDTAFTNCEYYFEESTIQSMKDNGQFMNMYLSIVESDSDRYLGQLVAWEKSYNNVARNQYFRFEIQYHDVPYNAEFYYDYSASPRRLVLIHFEPYATYLNRLLGNA